MRRKVFISLPKGGFQAETSVEAESPYDVVEAVRQTWQTLLPQSINRYDTVLIGDIVPIHNPTGIRDIGQIDDMAGKIADSDHITEIDGLPNIKLVVAPNGRLLLFDGHHTLLAYYRQGRKTLAEVSYLVIASEDDNSVTPGEIATFFPPENRQKVAKNWQKFIVNWQAPSGKQLEERKVNTIEELANTLGQGNERPSE